MNTLTFIPLSYMVVGSSAQTQTPHAMSNYRYDVPGTDGYLQDRIKIGKDNSIGYRQDLKGVNKSAAKDYFGKDSGGHVVAKRLADDHTRR